MNLKSPSFDGEREREDDVEVHGFLNSGDIVTTMMFITRRLKAHDE
jgi:hypothetical protein